jgi:hypothetical protein
MVRVDQNFLPCDQANGRMEDTPMKRTLERLAAQCQMADIVESLAQISMALAKRANRAKQYMEAALWKKNFMELSGTARTLYRPDLPDLSA